VSLAKPESPEAPAAPPAAAPVAQVPQAPQSIPPMIQPSYPAPRGDAR